jgi:DNA repair protein RecN (Recombination protein N)
VTELADAAGRAVAALAPEEGEGATALIGGAERSLAEVAAIAPELEVAAGELRDSELRLTETTLELRRFLDSLEAEPDRLEQVESELERIADAKRRFRCETYAELLARAAEARAELAAFADGADPLEAASAALA